MNKKARKSNVRILIDGKNVSTDLAPYLKSITFNDKTSAEVDDITITLDDRDELFCDDWMPMTGDSLEVEIICDDWVNNNETQSLYCGSMEIDLVEEKGPPNEISIKAVSSFNSNIRKTLNTKKWQKSTLQSICQEIASKHGLDFNFIPYLEEDKEGIQIEAIDQTDQSDLVFITKLAEDNDYVVKLDPEKLTLCAQAYLELQKPILTLSKNEISNRNAGRQGFNLYKEAKASYFCPRQKKNVSAKASHKDVVLNNPEWLASHTKPKKKKQSKKVATIPTKPISFFANNGGNKVLIIRQKFKSEAEALKTAKAKLAQKNRGEWKISGEVMGNPFLMAGIVIEIIDYGQFDGFYYIENTTHSRVSNGYRTSFVAHKILIEAQE
ncbi:MAG: hypothetical protein E6Q33_09025 [Neisseriales bacterium]|jgi:phage protein D|nr:MAG: hypothetical protein E6Q33_09025 [Neisseriales bacterium]